MESSVGKDRRFFSFTGRRSRISRGVWLRATGFSPNASTFLDLVRAHTVQGTFCDPFYGGNANFVGWDLIGYPGVRTAVTAEQQKMFPVNRRSAYDFSLFAKPSEE